MVREGPLHARVDERTATRRLRQGAARRAARARPRRRARAHVGSRRRGDVRRVRARAGRRVSALPDASTAPVISVVVVNWNGGEEVLACLRSLAAWPPSAPWEVILVDNASTDGSVARIRRALPWVRVIANQRNLGLAAGNNQGI